MAGDFDLRAVDLHFRAESLHAAECAVAILGRGEIAEFAGTVGEGSQHGVTVGNGFVARTFERAGHRVGGVDDFVFHLYRNFSMRKFAATKLFSRTVAREHAGTIPVKEARQALRIIDNKDERSIEIVRFVMSPRSALMQLLTKAAISFAALFVVG